MNRKTDNLPQAESPTAGDAPAHRPANRLIHEKSPYLLQHAHNPVDWYPWGDEAFARARQANQPIFLSVGYSTCHWCHVMERESFENPEIAVLLNEHFVSIKVDREERPDVDRVYMTFVQAATGRGGWPMSVWLTPDLKPFMGGTYFPPEDRAGQPGFPTILTRIARLWKADRERLVAEADRVMGILREQAEPVPGRSTDIPSGEAIAAAYERFSAAFDERDGGFGGAPKFPRPTVFNLLFRVGAAARPPSSAAERARDMALFTLRKMAAGGIHDHLGGGFHRYSVDAVWHVPHFEKMLYDQAQLAIAYLEAGQITREPFYAEVARDILDYVRRDLTSPEGGFYSAEDADSPLPGNPSRRAEGAFYVWTPAEITPVLGAKEAEVFAYHYGVEPGGNVSGDQDPHGELSGRNVLIQRSTVAETTRHFKLAEADVQRLLAECRRKLFEARAQRPRPPVDDKIIAAWNGLMISALARAGAILDEPAYTQAAAQAASFLKAQLYHAKTRALLRAYRQGPGSVPGFLADYAFLVQGLLDLYQASFDVQWLAWAVELQSAQDARFWDGQRGGYFDTAGQDPSILFRGRDDYDSAEPAPNSVAALNLLRLGCLLDSKDWLAKADRTFDAFARQLQSAPTALPQMLVALDFRLADPPQIVIAGRRDTPDTLAMIRELNRHFLSHAVVALADGGEGRKFIGRQAAWFRDLVPIHGQAAAYVCRNHACQLPVTDVKAFAQVLEEKRE